jgi:hypothetical protein
VALGRWEAAAHRNSGGPVGMAGREQAESGPGSPRLDPHAESGRRQCRQGRAAATTGASRGGPWCVAGWARPGQPAAVQARLGAREAVECARRRGKLAEWWTHRERRRG